MLKDGVFTMIEDEYADTQVSASAVKRLGDDDYQKLVAISRYWHKMRELGQLGIDPDELLGEAIAATSSQGKRRWRRSEVTLNHALGPVYEEYLGSRDRDRKDGQCRQE